MQSPKKFEKKAFISRKIRATGYGPRIERINVRFKNGSQVEVYWDEFLRIWVGKAWIHADGKAHFSGSIGDPSRRVVFQKIRAVVSRRRNPAIGKVTAKLTWAKPSTSDLAHAFGARA